MGLGPANQWGEQIPEPMSSFTNRAISPKNIAVEERRRTSRLLGKRELRRTVKRRDAIYAQLSAVGFWPAYDEFQRLAAARRNLSDALEGAVNGTREPLLRERQAAEQEQARLRAAHAAHIELYQEWRGLCEALNAHTWAVKRAEYEAQVNQELAREAGYFEDILVETWARLGYKHDTLWRNKRVVHKVGFSDIHITGDAVWYKINTTQKTLGRNFRSVLPYGVRVRDLVSEDTLYELSMGCQRQVTAVTGKSGAWVVVNRLDSVDGILTKLSYEQVMREYNKADHHLLPIPMGVGLKKEISWVFLSRYPHFLIGGTTGGGKSNLINVIICTLTALHGPDEVQLVLIDLKEGLEFQHYEKIPHLLMPIVLTVPDAEQVMRQLEALRTERSLQLAEARVKDIDEFNELMKARGLPRMPRVVVVFDEFAAIEDPYHKELRKSIQASAMQLTNKARAAGIHLILCTQRPSVDVVSGHIKDNMSFRIAGAMPTQAASMTILGVGDAATLPPIPGRMMAMAGSLKWQLQTPLISKDDVIYSVKKAMTYADDRMQAAAPRQQLPAATGSVGFGADDLLALVMDNFAGRMSHKDLWAYLKDTGLITYDPLRALYKDVRAQTPFTYEGVRYEWARQPGGHVQAETVEDDDGSDEAV